MRENSRGLKRCTGMLFAMVLAGVLVLSAADRSFAKRVILTIGGSGLQAQSFEGGEEGEGYYANTHRVFEALQSFQSGYEADGLFDTAEIISLPYIGAIVIDGDDACVQELVEAAIQMPEVMEVTDDFTIEAIGFDEESEIKYEDNEEVISKDVSFDDPKLNSQNHHNIMKNYDAWKYADGEGVVIVFFDSGVRDTHEDLRDNILWISDGDQSISGYTFTSGFTGRGQNDDYGHGTNVAGMAASVGNNGLGGVGVAYETKIFSMKIIDSLGKGRYTDLVSAMSKLIEVKSSLGDRKIVANFSLGGRSTPYELASTSEYFNRFASNGILSCIAAGNSNEDNDTIYQLPANVDSNGTIVTGYLDSNGTAKAPGLDGSNYGRTKVHVFAPGTAIYSTTVSSDVSYGSKSGSSFASPAVAGLAALVWSVKSDYSVNDVKNAILENVDVLSALETYCSTSGRVNSQKAVYYALNVDPPPVPDPGGGGGGCNAAMTLSAAVILLALLKKRDDPDEYE